MCSSDLPSQPLPLQGHPLGHQPTSRLTPKPRATEQRQGKQTTADNEHKQSRPGQGPEGQGAPPSFPLPVQGLPPGHQPTSRLTPKPRATEQARTSRPQQTVDTIKQSQGRQGPGQGQGQGRQGPGQGPQGQGLPPGHQPTSRL